MSSENGGKNVVQAKRPRVLLADDHSLVAAGISKLLEPDCELLGTVTDGRTLINSANTTHPDVILIDISMPGLNGFEAAREIRKTLPSCKVLFITMHSERDYVQEAFRSGGAGYVFKGSTAEELPIAIREVLNNNLYLTPLIDRRILDEVFRGDARWALTARQREVLQLVAEGHTAKEIGSILHISSKTAEFHKAAIMEKLNLHSTAELTKYAIANRITGN